MTRNQRITEIMNEMVAERGLKKPNKVIHHLAIQKYALEVVYLDRR